MTSQSHDVIDNVTNRRAVGIPICSLIGHEH